MVEGDYNALTLIETIYQRDGLSLRAAPLWGSRGERV